MTVHLGQGLEAQELVLLNAEEERILSTNHRVNILFAQEALEGDARAEMHAKGERMELLLRQVAMCRVVEGLLLGLANYPQLQEARVGYLAHIVLSLFKVTLCEMLDSYGQDPQSPLYSMLASKEIQEIVKTGFVTLDVTSLLEPGSTFKALLIRCLEISFAEVKVAGGEQIKHVELALDDVISNTWNSPSRTAANGQGSPSSLRRRSSLQETFTRRYMDVLQQIHMRDRVLSQENHEAVAPISPLPLTPLSVAIGRGRFFSEGVEETARDSNEPSAELTPENALVKTLDEVDILLQQVDALVAQTVLIVGPSTYKQPPHRSSKVKRQSPRKEEASDKT